MPCCRGSVPGCVVDPLQLNIQKKRTTNEPRVLQHPRYVYGSWLRVRELPTPICVHSAPFDTIVERLPYRFCGEKGLPQTGQILAA
jgi:hypothetical protein